MPGFIYFVSLPSVKANRPKILVTVVSKQNILKCSGIFWENDMQYVIQIYYFLNSKAGRKINYKKLNTLFRLHDLFYSTDIRNELHFISGA
jgi:hypothetical protein